MALSNMASSSAITRLSHLRALLITGSDAQKFLQSQLSSNVDLVDAQTCQLSAWCALSGRVIALGWLGKTISGYVWYVLEQEAMALRDGLLKFRLRARCQIELDARTVSSSTEGDAKLNLPDGRTISLIDSGCDAAAEGHLDAWHLADIVSGYPTHGGGERFLPQMLSLERFGGLSLKKGCFPGQEVISRLHFKGELKRELRRLRASTAIPAGRYRLSDREAEIEVIQSVDCDLLAVVPKNLDSTRDLSEQNASPQYVIRVSDMEVHLSLC
jgi:tRNA-modifying protein YgfZ